MVKSMIHNVCVNRGTEREIEGMRSRLLYVVSLPPAHFFVLPAGFMKIPQDANETGEMSHTSLSLSLSSPYLLKLNLSSYRSYFQALKRAKNLYRKNKMTGEAFIHTAINLNQHLTPCCTLLKK